MGWVFSAYGISCTLGALFILFCIPETKGKPYAVIEAELRGGKRDPPADAAPGSANPLVSVVCA
ncbi:hypothetical protein DIPPA_24414 [Diplonema papillatum]|nr:hypothetical protein DIPPA_24414 [Diplonema papillatum]